MNTDKRTDDELKLIIAEWSGYAGGYIVTNDGKHPLNYCRDLNAVHEAEKKLDSEWSGRYAGEIIDIGCELGVCWTTRSVASICATARQRAEALIKVIESSR